MAKQKLSRADQVKAARDNLLDRHKGKVFCADDYSMPWELRRLPTGILELDIAIQGGFPAGGMTMIKGKEGVGKSWLALQVIREQQLIFGEDCAIAWVSTEMPFDKTQAHLCDVACPMSNREIKAKIDAYKRAGDELPKAMVKSMGRKVGIFDTVPPCNAEDSLEIALQMLESRAYNVVVIDSFGSLMTSDDETKELDKEGRVGGSAKLNTRFTRRLNSIMSIDEDGYSNLSTVIGINQLRDNMNKANKYSPESVEPGGRALKHARWLGIELRRAGWVTNPSNKKIRLGKDVSWEITKQKAGGHEGAKGNYDFLYSLGGVDVAEHTLLTATTYGIVERSGAHYSYGETKLGAGSKRATAKLLELDLYDAIRQQTLDAAGIRCLYT